MSNLDGPVIVGALGGGLGHITRARAALHTLGVPEARATLVVSGPAGSRADVVGAARVRALDPALAKSPRRASDAIAAILHEAKPSLVVVDAFVAGVVGEWQKRTVPAGVRVVHIARRVRWDAYVRRLPAHPLVYDEVLVTEALEAEHRSFLGAHAHRIYDVDLVDPPAELDDVGRRLLEGRRPLWLVVHSGPASEVEQLLAYARACAAAENVSPRIELIGAGGTELYPAWPLFEHVDRLVTAAGANAARQGQRIGARHLMLPLERALDDQFWRAGARRERNDAPRPAARA